MEYNIFRRKLKTLKHYRSRIFTESYVIQHEFTENCAFPAETP